MQFFFTAMIIAVMSASSLAPAFSSKAQAAELSAADLLVLCISEKEAEQAQCIGYIRGLLDYHKLTQSLGTAPTVDFCVPPNMQVEDLVRVVRDYLIDNNQHQSFIASPAVALAFYELFPCAQ